MRSGADGNDSSVNGGSWRARFFSQRGCGRFSSAAFFSAAAFLLAASCAAGFLMVILLTLGILCFGRSSVELTDHNGSCTPTPHADFACGLSALQVVFEAAEIAVVGRLD